MIVSVGNPILKDFVGCKYEIGNTTNVEKISSIEMVNNYTKEIWFVTRCNKLIQFYTTIFLRAFYRFFSKQGKKIDKVGRKKNYKTGIFVKDST